MKRSSRHPIAALALAAISTAPLAQPQPQPPGQPSGLVVEVRLATRDFHDVGVAIGAGYASAGSCVSGPQAGAMGIHYPHGAIESLAMHLASLR